MGRLFGTDGAVSYTHLDVYKRQYQTGRGEQRALIYLERRRRHGAAERDCENIAEI